MQHALGLVEAASVSRGEIDARTHVPQSSATSTPRPLVISSSFFGMSLPCQTRSGPDGARHLVKVDGLGAAELARLLETGRHAVDADDALGA